MSFEELVGLWETNPDAIFENKEYADQLQSYLKKYVSGNNVSTHMTADESANKMSEIMNWAMSTPSGRRYFQQQTRDRNADLFVRRNKPFYDALLSGIDLSTSLSQIKQSKEAAKKLVKPTLPSPNVLDPAINNAISQAQTGNFEALRALEPAKQEIAQQRAMDMSTARSLSGGQAGAYGAMATAASLRANRSAARLPAIGDQIRARQQQRYDNLLGLRQGQLQNNFGNAMQVANANMNQYNLDAQAAAALGVAGRTNLRNTLGTAGDTFSRAIGSGMPIDDPYQEWDAYGSKVRNNVANSMYYNSRVSQIPQGTYSPNLPRRVDRYGNPI